jgi:uncharacterized membrane protein YuzA (DUF378 family)
MSVKNNISIFYTLCGKGKNMKAIDKIALILVIIGAINWGLIGILNFNLVELIFGNMTIIARIVYALVGISGLWAIKLLFYKD